MRTFKLFAVLVLVMLVAAPAQAGRRDRAGFTDCTQVGTAGSDDLTGSAGVADILCGKGGADDLDVQDGEPGDWVRGGNPTTEDCFADGYCDADAEADYCRIDPGDRAQDCELVASYANPG